MHKMIKKNIFIFFSNVILGEYAEGMMEKNLLIKITKRQLFKLRASEILDGLC